MTDECRCRSCLEARWAETQEEFPVWGMILCSTCGNKRCPHANHHDNACTRSNELNQLGSAYDFRARA